MARRKGFGSLGKMQYVPPNVLKQLDNIKNNYGIKRNSMAFNKMAELAPVGMEFEKMRDRFFLQDIFGKKKKANEKKR